MCEVKRLCLHLSREQQTEADSGAPVDRAAAPANVRIKAQTHQSGNTQSVQSDIHTHTLNRVFIRGMPPTKLLHIRALSIPCRKKTIDSTE